MSRRLMSRVLRGLMFAAVAPMHLAMAADPAQPLQWYRGNTHTHTINSDGDTSPDTVARWYKEHDYQFLFITDHEYVTDPAPLNAVLGASERFLLLPGQEITQWGADPARSAAHVNSLFTTQVILPMGERSCMGSGCGATVPVTVPLAETFRTNIAAIIAAHGIPQINHPNYRWSVKPEDLSDVPSGCLLEIWNGQGHINNLGGTDDKGDSRPSAEGYWDILLSRGKVIWGVASDDSHEFGSAPNPDGAAPGQGWIVVHAPDLTSGSIESALRGGQFYASNGVSLDDIAVTTEKTSPKNLAITVHVTGRTPDSRPRYLTRFVGDNGKVLSEVPGTHPTYVIKGNERYIRAVITDSNGKRAWTQPVFTDGRTMR